MKQTILVLTALLLSPLAALHAQTITLNPNDAGLRVEIDGQLFTEYVTKDTPRPFMYPLIGAAGVNVSRDFPMKKDVPGEEHFLDHKHHRSLWFGHSKVNEINFWGEHLVFGKQEHTGFSKIKSSGNQGSFLAATKWVAPTGETVLTDERRITITALPEGRKTLDFDITLKATEGDVLLGDTKEGTMAMRLCPSLSMNSSKNFVNTGNSTGHAFNSNGVRDHDIWGKHANWVCYYGPDPKGNPVGGSLKHLHRLTVGGPSERQFITGKSVQLTPTLDYAAYDWSAPPKHRRSIYRFVWRGVPDPFMDTLDFPDLGMLAPVRGFSASSLQSLALYNNSFVLHFSSELGKQITTPADAVRRIFLREPTADELRDFAACAQKNGLAALCRVLINSNEFLFVD